MTVYGELGDDTMGKQGMRVGLGEYWQVGCPFPPLLPARLARAMIVGALVTWAIYTQEQLLL